jgi:hypothetical protein
VLFGLRLRRGDTQRTWLLHLDVLIGETVLVMAEQGGTPIKIGGTQTWNSTVTADGKPRNLEVSSRMSPVTVTVTDGDGAPLGRSAVSLPATLLSGGLLRAVEQSRILNGGTADHAIAEQQIRPVVEAVIGMVSLLNVVQNDKVLADYFWQVVEKPSVWSVIANFGVTASIRMAFEKSTPVTRLPAHLPPSSTAFAVPLQVDVNGSPALLVEILAADPARPYALCGGMVAATARHPTDPGLQFDVILLAAHRAEGETRARIQLDDRPKQ